MKNLTSLLLIVCLLFHFFGVSGQDKKVAVTTFYMNKKVQAGDLGLGAAALKKSADLADNPAFNLAPMLDKLHETFFDELSKEFPFQLLDEATVIENQAYKDYQVSFDETNAINKAILSYLIIYDGYKYLREGGKLGAKEKRDEYRLMQIFSDQTDGIMFVNLYFAFKKKLAVGGTGTAGISAYFQMQLFNKEGKKVFRYHEYAVSKKSVGIVGGVPVMDIKKILPMCQDSFEKMLGKMKKDIPKLTKKVDKKL